MDNGGDEASGHGNGENHEIRANRYLREHFAYIRDLIAGRVVYPNVAVRMGWSGRVAVSFVIREDGDVEELRVAKTSGYPMLDADAVKTVRRSAPFPRPPVRARLVVPVEYMLN
jgi:protein TonB